MRFVVFSPGGTRTVDIDAERAVVGSSADCDIVLKDPSASPYHAMVTAHEGVLELRDLASDAGTTVDGQRITEPTSLGSGSRFVIGDSVVQAELEVDSSLGASSLRAGLPETSDPGSEHAGTFDEITTGNPRAPTVASAQTNTWVGSWPQPARGERSGTEAVDHADRAQPQPADSRARATTDRAPQGGEPPRHPRSGKATISGTARRVQFRPEMRGRRSEQVLGFRLDTFDSSGNLAESFPVEMRGSAISGQLSDDEDVEVSGKFRDGMLVSKKSINRTNGGVIVARMQRRYTVVYGILGLLLVFTPLTVLGGWLIHKIQGPSGSEKIISQQNRTLDSIANGTPIQVPDLSNDDVTTLPADIQNAGLRDQIQAVSDPVIPDSFVVRTDPPAGATIAAGSTITVYISCGPNPQCTG